MHKIDASILAVLYWPSRILTFSEVPCIQHNLLMHGENDVLNAHKVIYLHSHLNLDLWGRNIYQLFAVKKRTPTSLHTYSSCFPANPFFTFLISLFRQIYGGEHKSSVADTQLLHHCRKNSDMFIAFWLFLDEITFLWFYSNQTNINQLIHLSCYCNVAFMQWVKIDGRCVTLYSDQLV